MELIATPKVTGTVINTTQSTFVQTKMKRLDNDLRIVQASRFFPRLKRGHRVIGCGIKDCNGNHFQNPMEQAVRWLEQNGQAQKV